MDKHNFFIEHLQLCGLNPNAFLLVEKGGNSPWFGSENLKKVMDSLDENERTEAIKSAVDILNRLQELAKNQDFINQLDSFERYTPKEKPPVANNNEQNKDNDSFNKMLDELKGEYGRHVANIKRLEGEAGIKEDFYFNDPRSISEIINAMKSKLKETDENDVDYLVIKNALSDFSKTSNKLEDFNKRIANFAEKNNKKIASLFPPILFN